VVGVLGEDDQARRARGVLGRRHRGSAQLVEPGGRGGGSALLRDIAIGGRERAAVLVEWLDELVYTAETEDLVPEDAARIELSDGGLVATVRCRRGSPRHLIKAATYPIHVRGSRT
jgi:hypothetical protein